MDGCSGSRVACCVARRVCGNPSRCLVRGADLPGPGRGGSARRALAEDAPKRAGAAPQGSCREMSLRTERSNVRSQPRKRPLQDECSTLAAGRAGQVRRIGVGLAGPTDGELILQSRITTWSLSHFQGFRLAHKRLNALLSAGSLSASVSTTQTASRSSSLRTFAEPVVPSSNALRNDTAMFAKPFCRSLTASSSTCSGARRTNERSRHRTVSKLSAPAFMRA